MIEVPEAVVLVDQLKDTILNKKVIKVIDRQSPHAFAWFNDELDYQKELVGDTVKDVCNYGGIVEIIFGNSFLTFRDGSNFRYIENEKKLPKKHQLLLQFEDDTFLVATTQMYGLFWLAKERDESDFYYQIAKLNSNPTRDDFTYEYFVGVLDNCSQKISIKAALATEQRIPGIGNGVLQDILFKARLNPKNKISTLTEEQKKVLYDQLVTTISEMIKKGGRDTEKDLFGNKGGYEVILSSKTYKNGCPVCHSEIVKQAYLGGSIYYCPVCQPIIK